MEERVKVPKVSMIVPVYKVEHYLCRCVDSILGQSYQDFELILVDDGSPDNCGAICDAYARQDHRVHVIHQENAGVSAARNAGIEWALRNSDSQWVVFVDSDDWLHRDFLRIMLKAAQNKNAQISMSGCVWTAVFLEDSEIGDIEVTVMKPEEALVQHHAKCTPPWGKVICKSLLRELRFPQGMRYEDAAISHILTLSANCIAICSAQLYYYYSNAESFTRVKWTEGRITAIKVHEDRMDYFLKNGYLQAYKKEQLLYLEVLTENLQTLMHMLDDGELYRSYFHRIHEKHRSAFRKIKTERNIRLQRETMWSYFFALPTDVVWKTARAAQKLYHKIKN